jgi:hypothetical protein
MGGAGVSVHLPGLIQLGGWGVFLETGQGAQITEELTL